MQQAMNHLPVSYDILLKMGVNQYDTALFKETFGVQEITLSTWVKQGSASLYGYFDFIKNATTPLPLQIQAMLQELTLQCAEQMVGHLPECDALTLSQRYLAQKRASFRTPEIWADTTKTRSKILDTACELAVPIDGQTFEQAQTRKLTSLILHCVGHAGEINFAGPEHAERTGLFDRTWFLTALSRTAEHWESEVAAQKAAQREPSAEALSLSAPLWGLEITLRKGKKFPPVTLCLPHRWSEKALAVQAMLAVKSHYELYCDEGKTSDEKTRRASGAAWCHEPQSFDRPSWHKAVLLWLDRDHDISVATPWCKRGAQLLQLSLKEMQPEFSFTH